MPSASTSTSRRTSISSLYSAPSASTSTSTSDLPRPTLADIALPARRVTRDGTSTRRGTSVSSSGSSRVRGGMSRRSASRLSTTRSAVNDGPRNDGADDEDEIEITGGRMNPARTPPMYRTERTGDLQFRFRRDRPVGTRGDNQRTSNGQSHRPKRTRAKRSARRRERGHDRYGTDELNSTDASSISHRLDSSPSLTPPPPEDTPPPPPPPLSRALSAIDDSRAIEPGSSRGAGSSSSYTPPERNPDGSRRYTAKEKGKGKAKPRRAIEIGDDDGSRDGDDQEDSFEVIDVTHEGRKRKRENAKEVVEIGSSQEKVRQEPEHVTADETGKGDHAQKEGDKVDPALQDKRKIGVDEEKALASYTCPICFCAPEQPVITLCGHVTCAKCLLDSLLAAIKRNPDPTPGRHPYNHRGRGRGGAHRGRGGRGGGGGGTYNPSHHSSRLSTHPLSFPMGGPAEWTLEALKTVWYESKEREYYRKLAENGMEESSWAVSRQLDDSAPKAETTVVTEELKGLWALDGVFYVVEGECPVCRNALPGGYGPPGSGIGGVLPLYPMLNKGR